MSVKQKGCELCAGTARIYCESDEARLCFECDAKVHGANFLVARHCRVLLCRCCQDPTPWKAEGPRLGPTISVCDKCLLRKANVSKEEDYDENGEADFEDDDSEEEEEEEEEEEGEEQVVPGTEEEEPPEASSSSSVSSSLNREGEEEEAAENEDTKISEKGNGNGNGNGGVLKRDRDNVLLDLYSTQDQLRNPSLRNRTAILNKIRSANEDDDASDSFRPSKDRKKTHMLLSDSNGLSFKLMPPI